MDRQNDRILRLVIGQLVSCEAALDSLSALDAEDKHFIVSHIETKTDKLIRVVAKKPTLKPGIQATLNLTL